MKNNNYPRCGNRLVSRNGKYGNFLGCTGFPRCKYSESVVKKQNNNYNSPRTYENSVGQWYEDLVWENYY